MSKKRNVALNSKWKLNKELGDYKQHKQNKRTLGYAEEPKMKQGKSKHKKYPCRRLKGEHDFVLDERTSNIFINVGHIDKYICSACGKHKIIFKKQTI